MHKIITFIMGWAMCGAAYAGPMVNVEYIHAAIKQKWDIDIPYNPALKNPKVAANMKYLLIAVDRANRKLNGKETTDYGNSEYATLAAADTIATNDAVARLIKKDYKFKIITTDTVSNFSFNISAMGNFLIDWGDGQTQEFERTNTAETTYSHTYSTAGKYTIGIDGQATEYSTDTSTAAISFSGNTKIVSVDGSLGAIFGTIGDGCANGWQPRFYQTFYNTLIEHIPENLFTGISGPATSYMFYGTFQYCRLIDIPEKLFADITGPAADYMFANTFRVDYMLSAIPEKLFASIKGPVSKGMFERTFGNCYELVNIPEGLFANVVGPGADSAFYDTFAGSPKIEAIPPKLFATITGPGAFNMFRGTFYHCTGLTEIPENLFSGITTTAQSLFVYTFDGCTGITRLPKNLFGNLSGSAQKNMFGYTFNGCVNLSGDSVKINDKYLYEIWPDATSVHVGRCYSGDTGLSDYDNIPSAWK